MNNGIGFGFGQEIGYGVGPLIVTRTRVEEGFQKSVDEKILERCSFGRFVNVGRWEVVVG